MSKGKTWFLLLAVLSLVALVALAIPNPAQAAIVTSPPPKWSGMTFTGTDMFYGTGVVAFEEGTTAHLEAQVSNTAGVDVTIKSATVTFDWGSYDATSIDPTQLAPNEVAIVKFDFDVPTIATASNLTLHSYRIDVVYDEPAYPWYRYKVAGDYLGWGNDDYWLDDSPIVPGTASIYSVDIFTGEVTLYDSSDYTLDEFTGWVHFPAATPFEEDVYADYWYPANLAEGNGEQKVFQISLPANATIVPGSESICIENWVTDTTTKLASDAYTIDYETGQLTLDTAPFPWEDVTYSCTFERHWYYTSDAFAVYSADQADAQELWLQYQSLWDEWWPQCTALLWI